MIKWMPALVALLPSMALAQSPTSCNVLSQSQLLQEFRSCADQGLSEPCIHAATMRDIICSISSIAGSPSAGPVPTMASTGFVTFTTPQDTASVFDTPIGVTVADVDQHADTMRALCKPAPATPYTLTGKFTLNAAFGANNFGATIPDSWGGFAWFDDATTKLIGWGILNQTFDKFASVYSIDFTNYNTYANSAETQVDTFSPTLWIKAGDDGTNIIQQYSMDGTNYIQANSFPKTGSFLGTNGFNHICIFVSAHGSDAKLSLQSYTESSP
jgi:hypothetical protein